VPALMAYPKNLKKDESVDIDNELAQTALQGVENMIVMCPNEAQTLVNNFLEVVSASLAYDPSYV